MYILCFIKPCIIPKTTHIIQKYPTSISTPLKLVIERVFTQPLFQKLKTSFMGSPSALIELDFTRGNILLE